MTLVTATGYLCPHIFEVSKIKFDVFRTPSKVLIETVEFWLKPRSFPRLNTEINPPIYLTYFTWRNFPALSEVKMIFKEQLKKLMKGQNLTIRQLSEQTGVPEGTIKTYLRGAHPRNITDVRKIAKLFNVSLEHIFFGEEDAASPKTLEEIPLEEIYDGWVKIRLERAVKISNRKKT